MSQSRPFSLRHDNPELRVYRVQSRCPECGAEGECDTLRPLEDGEVRRERRCDVCVAKADARARPPTRRSAEATGKAGLTPGEERQMAERLRREMDAEENWWDR